MEVENGNVFGDDDDDMVVADDALCFLCDFFFVYALKPLTDIFGLIVLNHFGKFQISGNDCNLYYVFVVFV